MPFVEHLRLKEFMSDTPDQMQADLQFLMHQFDLVWGGDPELCDMDRIEKLRAQYAPNDESYD